MKRKSNKTVKSINFDNEVLICLDDKCGKEKINMSTFVNNLVRQNIMSEYEYYRQLFKNARIESAKYETLMNSAKDAPLSQ